MAAISKPTGTPSHYAFAKLATGSAKAAYGDIVGTGKLIVPVTNKTPDEWPTNLLGDCISFGPIVQTGNPAEWTPMGKSVTKSIAGAASLGEFPIRVVVTESNTLHAGILAANVGSDIEVALLKHDGTNAVVYYAYGEIASKENAFETPGEFGFSISLSADNIRKVSP